MLVAGEAAGHRWSTEEAAVSDAPVSGVMGQQCRRVTVRGNVWASSCPLTNTKPWLRHVLVLTLLTANAVASSLPLGHPLLCLRVSRSRQRSSLQEALSHWTGPAEPFDSELRLPSVRHQLL